VNSDASAHRTSPARARRAASEESSLAKGVRLLDELGQLNRPVGLTELSRTAGLAKSTTHRLLSSLVAAGLVSQQPDGRYALGLRLFELGSRAGAALDVRSVARPQLERLRDTTGETAHLGVLLGDEVVYIEKVESEFAVRMSSRVGGRNPLHCTALGKCLLATGSEALSERVLSRPLMARTPRTHVDPDRLRQELSAVRARGWALDDEESDEGLRCIGASVRGAEGTTIAAVSISGPSTRVTKARVRALAADVVSGAREISARMGATGDLP